MHHLSCTSDNKCSRLGKCASVVLLAMLAAVYATEALCAFPGMELPDQAEPEPTILETMDTPRNLLSDEVIDFSTKIDHFFGDPRHFQESNKSVIQVFVNQSVFTGGNFNTWIDGQAKIHLPSAEKRFHLVLESDPEKKAANETKQDQVVPAKDTKIPVQYAASLRYEKAEVNQWHYSADSGINVQFPLDPFVRTRGSYEVPLEDWRLKFSETVFWFSTLGLGQTAQYEMSNVISDKLLFRATTTANCLESPQLCNFRQDLAFFQNLDESNVFQYQLSLIGDDNPKLRETDYLLLMRYRHKLHREWMFFEVTPQLSFPRTDSFKMNPSIIMRLEMLFGATS